MLMRGVAHQLKMANKIWTAFFLIISALLGYGSSEIIDQTSCQADEPLGCQACPKATVLAYVNNCETGEQDKYFCDDIGIDAECKSTVQILSEIG